MKNVSDMFNKLNLDIEIENSNIIHFQSKAITHLRKNIFHRIFLCAFGEMTTLDLMKKINEHKFELIFLKKYQKDIEIRINEDKKLRRK